MGRWWSPGSEDHRKDSDAQELLLGLVMKRIQITAIWLFVAISARCQLVEIGPPDPHYCEKEKVLPNLIVDQRARISARLIDQTGTPFQNSPVELRIYMSPTRQSAVAKVNTNHDGRFRFDRVDPGRYRLIASATRAFQQPAELRCGSNECELVITLRANPTDLPYSQCPLR